MGREEFFRDVRRAVSFMASRVEADAPFTDTRYIESKLQGADTWLAQGVVEAYRAEDFAELDEEERNKLKAAVDNFRTAVRDVPPTKPAMNGQRQAALKPFVCIVQIVQRLIREDWISACAQLSGQAEAWAKEAGWPTKRFAKDITEDFIGRYQVDRLVFSAEGSQLALVPVGRFVPGADGMFDLAVLPAYDSMMVVRHDSQWFIQPLPGAEGRQDWTKETFIEASLKLARLA